MMAASLSAMQVSLSPLDVDEALRIGQTRIASERTRFHAPYRVVVARAPVDYIEVITPFRRIVLAAESRVAIGDRGFGQRQALEINAAAEGELELQIELTFNPLNTYIGVPDYQVTLTQGTTRVVPTRLVRIPRFGLRVEGPPVSIPTPTLPTKPGPTQPMLGGQLVAVFDGRSLDATAAGEIQITEGAQEIARAAIPLGRLR